MAFFSGRSSRLPNYTDVSLEGLGQDPLWKAAMARSGLDVARCDFVWRAGHVMLGLGPGSPPEHVRPALVVGDGARLALVYPGEREVRVVTRPTEKAELQTQRSGDFQLLFGPVGRMDVWVLTGLQPGTPDGDRFGRSMSAFLRGEPSAVTLPPEPVPTPPLVAEARTFMEDWTRVVGQAEDDVFWAALARFGQVGGAIQGGLLPRVAADDLPQMLERPWRTWMAIVRWASEAGDQELAVWVFLFAYVMVNQVEFDVETVVRCGFQAPDDQLYRDIAELAQVALDRAPDDFSVVERSHQPPISKQSLLLGLQQLLDRYRA